MKTMPVFESYEEFEEYSGLIEFVDDISDGKSKIIYQIKPIIYRVCSDKLYCIFDKIQYRNNSRSFSIINNINNRQVWFEVGHIIHDKFTKIMKGEQ